MAHSPRAVSRHDARTANHGASLAITSNNYEVFSAGPEMTTAMAKDLIRGRV
jgi:hypothetical protein